MGRNVLPDRLLDESLELFFLGDGDELRREPVPELAPAERLLSTFKGDFVSRHGCYTHGLERRHSCLLETVSSDGKSLSGMVSTMPRLAGNFLARRKLPFFHCKACKRKDGKSSFVHTGYGIVILARKRFPCRVGFTARKRFPCRVTFHCKASILGNGFHLNSIRKG